MKRWILMLVGLMIVAPVGARADDASKQAKVKELFALMHVDHTLDRMRSAMQQQVQLTAKNVSHSGDFEILSDQKGRRYGSVPAGERWKNDKLIG